MEYPSTHADRISRALDYYRPDIVHFCESLLDGNGESGAVDRAFALQGMIRERFPGMRLDLAGLFRMVSSTVFTDGWRQSPSPSSTVPM